MQTDHEKLVIYTITKYPSDFPNNFAVRRQFILKDAVPQNDPEYLVLTATLEEAREPMRSLGLVCIPRNPTDHPVIVESWI